jgi:hypothetical protein
VTVLQKPTLLVMCEFCRWGASHAAENEEECAAFLTMRYTAHLLEAHADELAKRPEPRAC